jgi:hypothetical protein
MVKTIYISGPMSGMPENNFPAFDAARDRLVLRGYNPISPADMDRRFGYCGHAREYAVRDTAAILKECHGIYLLNGWANSYGAAAEYFLARWIAKDEPDFTFECENGGNDPMFDFVWNNLPDVTRIQHENR